MQAQIVPLHQLHLRKLLCPSSCKSAPVRTSQYVQAGMRCVNRDSWVLVRLYWRACSDEATHGSRNQGVKQSENRAD
jgi:hypothetical protein